MTKLTIDDVKPEIERLIKEYLNVDSLEICETTSAAVEIDSLGDNVVRCKILTFCNEFPVEEGEHYPGSYYKHLHEAVEDTLRNFDPSMIIIGENKEDGRSREEKTVRLYWRVTPTVEKIKNLTREHPRYYIRMRLGIAII